MEKIFKPWYNANPLPDPETGGMTWKDWDSLKFEIEFGKVEKKDIPVQDQIKLLELYINSPLPKDPVVLNNLFIQAGLGITKDMDDQLEQMFSPEQLMMNQMMSQPQGFDQQGENPQQDYDSPQVDNGGGEVGPDFSSGTTSPPMDEAIYDSMAINVRGDFQNNYKRSNQSQDWNYGRDYE
jgi:hypothetical protein